MIRTNIRTRKYSNIFEYPNIRHTLVCFLEFLDSVIGSAVSEISQFACFYEFYVFFRRCTIELISS